MSKKLFILLLIVLIFNSCDILRTSPFEVISWTPGGGYYPDAENIVVSLCFSHDADRDSVERHFSLTGDGNRVRGTFQWNGREMIFIPLVPLEKNTEYIINLSANAHDTEWLSMDEAFYRKFTTREDSTRPVLISSYPEMYERVTEPRAEVSLRFSIPVPLDALYDNVSFNPSMSGSWRLEDNGALAVFTPVEPWAQNSRYQLNILSSLTDNNNNSIGNEHSIVFITGIDDEAPYLIEARRITKNNDYIELNADRGYTFITESPVENDGWEKDDKLSLVFSKPVDSISVRNYLNAEDAPSMTLETPPGFYEEIIFRFDGAPDYESRFTFRLKPGVKDNTGNETKDEYIFRIFANGESSRPPALVGIRMPMSPNDNTELVYFNTETLFEFITIRDENYPSGEMIKTWIEFYFLTAEGASIDQFSLMELFRVETSNNVINFSARQIKTSGFSVSAPHTGLENYQRVEAAGYLTNLTNFGIINFIIGSGLRDNLGNKNDKTQKISVVK